MNLHLRGAILAMTFGSVCIASHAFATGNVIANSRISVDFDDPDTGMFTGDADRVDSISWIDSNGNSTGNLAADSYGATDSCNDPYEYFGQAEGEPDEGSAPLMVTGGEVSTWTGVSDLEGKTATTGFDCNNNPLSGRTKTTYKLFTSKKKVNELEVKRKFLFNSRTQEFSNTGLRAYMARLPSTPYSTVLIPDSSGTVQTYDSNNCGFPCEITDWNGTWFADDDGNGNGMVVIRSSSSTAPAIIAIDSDGFSDSNLTSVVLEQPEGGWKSAVTETEYVCFYDSTSWTQTQQAAGQLPLGCSGS
ncbi:MAG TPA: hypothetical protein VGK90_01155 [Rhizomicrobium sp.]|jgi:hypothetical protein